MNIVIVRLDLDQYDPLTLSKLVREGVLTVGEACESRSVKSMSETHQQLWVHQVQENRKVA